MKKLIKAFWAVALVAFLSGCLSPVKNEIPLVRGLATQVSNTNETKVVIFNDSNRALFGIDGTGRINVRIDGKGVAQLNIGRYAQVILPKGRYQLDLDHLDLFHFRSKHVLELSEAQVYLKIYATMVGNEIKVVPVLPQSFAEEFIEVQPVK